MWRKAIRCICAGASDVEKRLEVFVHVVYRWQVHLMYVLFKHSLRTEGGSNGENSILDQANPTVRNTASVAVIIQGHNLFFQDTVDRISIGPVLVS